MNASTQPLDRFTTLPEEAVLTETLLALERRGFSAEAVDDLDAARETVLARIPGGSSVMTFPSVTLESAGIAEAIDDGERYDSARARGFGLDRTTQMRQIKTIMLQPEFALGSVHAITRDGILVLASALGSQLASHAWGADNVIFVAGAHKVVADVAAARERIFEHCLELEDARALAVYGGHSRIGKILEIHQEDPGRIHIVLVRAVVGY
jgi:hypothetical protein